MHCRGVRNALGREMYTGEAMTMVAEGAGSGFGTSAPVDDERVCSSGGR